MAIPQRQSLRAATEADSDKHAAKMMDRAGPSRLRSESEAILVAVDPDVDLATLSGPNLSPVQTIQDRLEQAFSVHEDEDADLRKDLRLVGLAVAVIISLIAWTLILQFVRIGL